MRHTSGRSQRGGGAFSREEAGATDTASAASLLIGACYELVLPQFGRDVQPRQERDRWAARLVETLLDGVIARIRRSVPFRPGALELLGQAGVHARSAVGVAVLPKDSPVELELVVELSAPLAPTA